MLGVCLIVWYSVKNIYQAYLPIGNSSDKYTNNIKFPINFRWSFPIKITIKYLLKILTNFWQSQPNGLKSIGNLWAKTGSTVFFVTIRLFSCTICSLSYNIWYFQQMLLKFFLIKVFLKFSLFFFYLSAIGSYIFFIQFVCIVQWSLWNEYVKNTN